MNHEDFVALYRARRIQLHIDKGLALKLVSAGAIPGGYSAAQNFFGWLWIIGLVAGPVVGFFYLWWVGALIFVVALMVPGALKETAAQGVRDHLLSDPGFYEIAREKGFFRVSEVEEGA